MKFSSITLPKRRTGTTSRGRVVTVLALVLAFGAASVAATVNIFKPFRNNVGTVQTASSDPSVLNGTNRFFDHLGNNGQACSTCHEPSQSFGLDINFMRERFEATVNSPELDPIFRFNDSADRPDADESTPAARRVAYKLALELGTTRIARPVPANAEFIATLEGATSSPAYSDQFGYLPNSNDPQNPGNMLSLFRRPLVNTNVHFDSAVLWDGREDVTTMPLQVSRAFKTLLLVPGVDPNGDLANEVANFMLGVFTAQETVDGAGKLSGAGALGGVDNLLALSKTYEPLICDPLNPSACPVVLGAANMTLFDSWASLPDTPSNSGRRAIARGQDLFNHVVLHQPSDLALPPFANIVNGEMHCTTCHGVPNVGNNPYAVFLGRLGTDSVQILTNLRNSRPDLPSLNDFVARLQKLPQYCFRAKTGPALSSVPCGQYAGDPTATPPIPADVLSTDPGRALNGRPGSAIMGNIGRFKPPILRGLAGRAPYFHQGAAVDIDALIDFYDARFSIHLTPQQHADLKAFLDAL